MHPERRDGVTVRLSGGLRHLAEGRRSVSVPSTTVREALEALIARYPALRSRLRGERGELRPSVVVFLNAEDTRAADGENTPVREGDELEIVPGAEEG